MEVSQVEQTLRDSYERVLATVTLLVGDDGTAQDAVQEAVVKLLDAEDVRNPSAWLVTVALNIARAGHRRRAAERRAVARLETQRPVADASDGVDVEVGRALALLTERQREIVVLHYLAELTVAEVGDAVGLATGTVKATLFQARRRLRSILEGVADSAEDSDARAR